MIDGRAAQSHALEHEKIEGIETPGKGRAFAYCPPDLDRQVESDPTNPVCLRSREKHREMSRGNRQKGYELVVVCGALRLRRAIQLVIVSAAAHKERAQRRTKRERSGANGRLHDGA